MATIPARHSGELLMWPAPLGRTVSSIFVPRHHSQTLMSGTESLVRADWTDGKIDAQEI
jgi:hypothetical protein